MEIQEGETERPKRAKNVSYKKWMTWDAGQFFFPSGHAPYPEKTLIEKILPIRDCYLPLNAGKPTLTAGHTEIHCRLKKNQAQNHLPSILWRA